MVRRLQISGDKRCRIVAPKYNPKQEALPVVGKLTRREVIEALDMRLIDNQAALQSQL